MIVILSVTDDVYVPDLVVDAVIARGHAAVRVDSDAFPAGIEGKDVMVSADDAGFAFGAEGVGGDVSAVWCRRRWAGSRLDHVDERFRAGAALQARTLLHAWLRALGPRCVNDVDAEDRAEDKLLQLRMARGLGFAVPETLVSNDPRRVRAFIAAQRVRGHGVITKLLAPLVTSMQADADFFFTAIVDDAALAHLDEVKNAPQIFQRRVDKTHELRVQVVGDRVFCGALSSTAQDWRLQAEGVWRAHELSPATQQRCLKLCRSLGLVTGAIDLVVDRDGVEHFLEVNPAGEWGFLQAAVGFDIAGAVADALIAFAGGVD